MSLHSATTRQKRSGSDPELSSRGGTDHYREVSTDENSDIDKMPGTSFANATVDIQEKKNADPNMLSDSEKEPIVMHFFVPSQYIHVVEKYDIRRKYSLNIVQRIFLLCDDHTSSYLSEAYTIVVMTATIITIFTLIFSTIPEIKHFPADCANPVCHNDPLLCPNKKMCEPIPPVWFSHIEDVCQMIFVIDYFLRNLLVGFVPTRLANVLPPEVDIPHVEPISGEMEVFTDKLEITNFFNLQEEFNYSYLYQQYLYSCSFMSIVDLVAIIPFFFELTNIKFVRLEIVRVIRLVRLLKLMRFGSIGESTKVLTRTMTSSFSALLILFIFALIGIVFFGSILYFFEGGAFEVSKEHPDGKYIRPTILGTNERYGGEYEISPFDSILNCMYWCFVTITTVGYGDYVATTYAGRFVSVICIYCGIFVFALPISVIGKNFSKELDIISGRGSDLVSNAMQELLDEFQYNPNFIVETKTKGILKQLKDGNFLKNKSMDTIRLLQLSQFKAKKLAALTIISRSLCSPKQQQQILKMAKDLGLSEMSDINDKDIDANTIRKIFSKLVLDKKRQIDKNITKAPIETNPDFSQVLVELPQYDKLKLKNLISASIEILLTIEATVADSLTKPDNYYGNDNSQ